MVVVERTMKPTHPLLVTCGDVLMSVVACEEPPVLDVKARLIESLALVTVLFAASFTQTVIVDCETPFAGIGFGETDVVICVGVPKPENEMVPEAEVSEPDVAVAVHASATLSLIVNFTVVPDASVLADVGLPPPPAGVVLVTVAPQSVLVFGWVMVSVIGVGPKTLLPPASWT